MEPQPRMTLVAEAYFHKRLDTYQKCIDRFLAPSQFVRDKFVDHGWDPAKFEVLSHFQPIHPVSESNLENAPLLYFGRLSREKGVADLLHAMHRLPDLHLTIAGDEPERDNLEQLSASLQLANVEFIGHLGRTNWASPLLTRVSRYCHPTHMKLSVRRFSNLTLMDSPWLRPISARGASWYMRVRLGFCTKRETCLS
jgi:glycosyltransferase involved in cell wall biosynthesis